jgi:hypothetical protein
LDGVTTRRPPLLSLALALLLIRTVPTKEGGDYRPRSAVEPAASDAPRRFALPGAPPRPRPERERRPAGRERRARLRPERVDRRQQGPELTPAS